MSHSPPRALVLTWAALMALLGLTVLLAYQPLGVFNTIVALTIATVKAALVAAIFMELSRRDGLTVVFACAGFFWLAILLWLAWTDFYTRPQIPPGFGGFS